MNETHTTWSAVDSRIEQPRGDGPWVIDETGLLDETQLQEVVELLHKQGINVIVVVTKSKSNGEMTDIINGYLTELGYGSTSHNQFPPDQLVCLLSYSSLTPGDVHGDVRCTIGEGMFRVISRDDLTHAQSLIGLAAKGGDPTQGFKAAFEYIYQQVQEDVADPTEDPNIALTPIPKATRIDRLRDPTPTLVVQPPGTNIVPSLQHEHAFNPGLVGVGATATALAVAALVTDRAIRPKVEMYRSIHELIAQSNMLFNSLSGTRNTNFLTLDSLIASSYPSEATQLMQRSAQYTLELDHCSSELRNLDAEAKRLMLKNKAELASLSDRYRAVLRRLFTLNDEQDELKKRINEARSKVETSSTKTEEANQRLDVVTEWYTQLQSSNDFLPTPEESLSKLYESKSSIVTAIESQATLVAYDQAVELLKSLDAFESAIKAFVVIQDRLVSLQQSVRVQVSQWPPGAPTSKAIFASSVWHINQAQEDLSDDLDYADVTGSVKLAEKELNQVEKFVTTYANSTREISDHSTAIVEIQSRGHIITQNITALQTDADRKLSQSTGAVVANNDWKNALLFLQEAVVSTKTARENFESWANLAKRNADALIELAQQVAKVDGYRKEQAFPAWEKLALYAPANYLDIEQNYETAADVLQTLSDDPMNVNDLVSQTEQLNSPEVQHYDVAEQKIGALRKELTRVENLFRAIVVQLEKVTYAEQNIEGSIEKAVDAIEKAKQSYAGGSDRLVTEATEEGTNKAERILGEARILLGNKNFLLAQEKVQEALSVAIQTQQSADAQVSKLKTALSQFESLQAGVRTDAHMAINNVASTSEVVVQKRTHQRSVELADQVGKLELGYVQLSKYEDTQLLQRVEALHQLSESIASDTKELRELLDDDEREYHQEQQITLKSVNAATRAISEAQGEVTKPHAYSVGKEDLERAESLLPKKLTGSESYSQLRQMQENAKQAQGYAEYAKQQARQRIRIYESSIQETSVSLGITGFDHQPPHQTNQSSSGGLHNSPDISGTRGPSRSGGDTSF